MMTDNIFLLGGSPCSGKSTIAELMAQRLGMDYFKLDDRLEDLMSRAAESGGKVCAASIAMSPQEIWMRDPGVQCQEEFEIYREIFPFALDELIAFAASGRPVITEGAGWLPELMKQSGVKKNRYVCLVPARVFQIVEYSKRPWVEYVLEGCENKEAAFANWMERDVQFALRTSSSAKRMGYRTVVNDGSESVEELYTRVTGLFGIEK